MKNNNENDREKSHEEMLEEACARPGIPEVMRVYGDYLGRGDLRPGAYRDSRAPARGFAPARSASGGGAAAGVLYGG